MACRQVGVEDLMDHLLGGLDEERHARVAAHVAGCPDCTLSLQALSRLNEVVWATREFHDIRVPPEVHEQILERCREALAAIAAMRRSGPPPAAPLRRSRAAGGRPAGRRHGPGSVVRRLAYVVAGVLGAVGFFLAFQALSSARRAAVGVIEYATPHVEVLPPGETEGFYAGVGQPLSEGDRLRTSRPTAAARVRLDGGSLIHVGGGHADQDGGGTTVRFLSAQRIEVLGGRAFAEASGRAVTVSAGDLAVTGSMARFDVRILSETASGQPPTAGATARDGPRAAADARNHPRDRTDRREEAVNSVPPFLSALGDPGGESPGWILLSPHLRGSAFIGGLSAVLPAVPGAGNREVLLTVVAGSVTYAAAGDTGDLEAGWQLRLAGGRAAPRRVEPAPFWARWMTEEECDALPVETLTRLVKGPLTRLDGGRVRLAYTFAAEAEMEDWQRTSGAGTWARAADALRGRAATGERALVYHVARFLGDLEVDFDAEVDPGAPQSQSLWRIHAEPGPWEVSGFSGWVAVERLMDGRPVRKVSLFYLDQTRASAPAAALSASRYHVAVRCAGGGPHRVGTGSVTFRAGAEGADVPALVCAIGDAPASGHVGLGVAGGDVSFRNIHLSGRLEPQWIRYALEQLGEQDLRRE